MTNDPIETQQAAEIEVQAVLGGREDVLLAVSQGNLNFLVTYKVITEVICAVMKPDANPTGGLITVHRADWGKYLHGAVMEKVQETFLEYKKQLG